MCWPNLKSVALSVPEILANGVLGGVANLQSRERGHRRLFGNGTIQRALVSSYGPSIVTYPLSLRVSETGALCSSMPLFPTPTLVSPTISPCSPECTDN